MIHITTFKGVVYFMNQKWSTPVYTTNELAQAALVSLIRKKEDDGFPTSMFMTEIIEVPIYDA